MGKESLSNIFKERKSVLFLSTLALIFSILTFASAGDNIFKYYLIKFSVVFAILVAVLFLFVLINKNHIRKIKNNKKLFLFGIIPFLIAVALILLISIVSFLCVLKMSLDPLIDSMNFFNWTLGVLFIYSALIVLVGIYFIFKKNKNIGYSFLKLGVSVFCVCCIIYWVIMIMATGPADFM